ncbi:MAG: RpiB/LacA/LacB family sugar-phosphate isomerase [Candidatus Paceibacterota bacterium]
MFSTDIKTIHLATDHAGFDHKEQIRLWLADSVYKVVDHGAKENHPLDDFPDFISLAAVAVSKNPQNSCAIIFGGSGQGEAMMANRYTDVRAVVYYGGNEGIVKLSRIHNNANVLSIGARFVSVDETKDLILKWLATPFSDDEKYQRRNDKIDSLSKDFKS